MAAEGSEFEGVLRRGIRGPLVEGEERDDSETYVFVERRESDESSLEDLHVVDGTDPSGDENDGGPARDSPLSDRVGELSFGGEQSSLSESYVEIPGGGGAGQETDRVEMEEELHCDEFGRGEFGGGSGNRMVEQNDPGLRSEPGSIASQESSVCELGAGIEEVVGLIQEPVVGHGKVDDPIGAVGVDKVEKRSADCFSSTGAVDATIQSPSLVSFYSVETQGKLQDEIAENRDLCRSDAPESMKQEGSSLIPQASQGELPEKPAEVLVTSDKSIGELNARVEVAEGGSADVHIEQIDPYQRSKDSSTTCHELESDLGVGVVEAIVQEVDREKVDDQIGVVGVDRVEGQNNDIVMQSSNLESIDAEVTIKEDVGIDEIQKELPGEVEESRDLYQSDALETREQEGFSLLPEALLRESPEMEEGILLKSEESVSELSTTVEVVEGGKDNVLVEQIDPYLRFKGSSTICQESVSEMGVAIVKEVVQEVGHGKVHDEIGAVVVDGVEESLVGHGKVDDRIGTVGVHRVEEQSADSFFLNEAVDIKIQSPNLDSFYSVATQGKLKEDVEENIDLFRSDVLESMKQEGSSLIPVASQEELQEKPAEVLAKSEELFSELNARVEVVETGSANVHVEQIDLYQRSKDSSTTCHESVSDLDIGVVEAIVQEMDQGKVDDQIGAVGVDRVEGQNNDIVMQSSNLESIDSSAVTIEEDVGVDEIQKELPGEVEESRDLYQSDALETQEQDGFNLVPEASLEELSEMEAGILLKSEESVSELSTTAEVVEGGKGDVLVEQIDPFLRSKGSSTTCWESVSEMDVGVLKEIIQEVDHGKVHDEIGAVGADGVEESLVSHGKVDDRIGTVGVHKIEEQSADCFSLNEAVDIKIQSPNLGSFYSVETQGKLQVIEENRDLFRRDVLESMKQEGSSLIPVASQEELQEKPEEVLAKSDESSRELNARVEVVETGRADVHVEQIDLYQRSKDSSTTHHELESDLGVGVVEAIVEEVDQEKVDDQIGVVGVDRVEGQNNDVVIQSSNPESIDSAEVKVKGDVGVDETRKELPGEVKEDRDLYQSDALETREQEGFSLFPEASLDELPEREAEILLKSEESVSELSTAAEIVGGGKGHALVEQIDPYLRSKGSSTTCQESVSEMGVAVVKEIVQEVYHGKVDDEIGAVGVDGVEEPLVDHGKVDDQIGTVGVHKVEEQSADSFSLNEAVDIKIQSPNLDSFYSVETHGKLQEEVEENRDLFRSDVQEGSSLIPVTSQEEIQEKPAEVLAKSEESFSELNARVEVVETGSADVPIQQIDPYERSKDSSATCHESVSDLGSEVVEAIVQEVDQGKVDDQTGTVGVDRVEEWNNDIGMQSANLESFDSAEVTVKEDVDVDEIQKELLAEVEESRDLYQSDALETREQEDFSLLPEDSLEELPEMESEILLKSEESASELSTTAEVVEGGQGDVLVEQIDPYLRSKGSSTTCQELVSELGVGVVKEVIQEVDHGKVDDESGSVGVDGVEEPLVGHGKVDDRIGSVEVHKVEERSADCFSLNEAVGIKIQSPNLDSFYSVETQRKLQEVIKENRDLCPSDVLESMKQEGSSLIPVASRKELPEKTAEVLAKDEESLTALNCRVEIVETGSADVHVEHIDPYQRSKDSSTTRYKLVSDSSVGVQDVDQGKVADQIGPVGVDRVEEWNNDIVILSSNLGSLASAEVTTNEDVDADEIQTELYLEVEESRDLYQSDALETLEQEGFSLLSKASLEELPYTEAEILVKSKESVSELSTTVEVVEGSKGDVISEQIDPYQGSKGISTTCHESVSEMGVGVVKDIVQELDHGKLDDQIGAVAVDRVEELGNFIVMQSSNLEPGASAETIVKEDAGVDETRMEMCGEVKESINLYQSDSPETLEQEGSCLLPEASLEELPGKDAEFFVKTEESESESSTTVEAVEVRKGDFLIEKIDPHQRSNGDTTACHKAVSEMDVGVLKAFVQEVSHGKVDDQIEVVGVDRVQKHSNDIVMQLSNLELCSSAEMKVEGEVGLGETHKELQVDMTKRRDPCQIDVLETVEQEGSSLISKPSLEKIPEKLAEIKVESELASQFNTRVTAVTGRSGDILTEKSDPYLSCKDIPSTCHESVSESGTGVVEVVAQELDHGKLDDQIGVVGVDMVKEHSNDIVMQSSNLGPGKSAKTRAQGDVGVDETHKELHVGTAESRYLCWNDAEETVDQEVSRLIPEASLEERPEKVAEILVKTEYLVSEFSARVEIIEGGSSVMFPEQTDPYLKSKDSSVTGARVVEVVVQEGHGKIDDQIGTLGVDRVEEQSNDIVMRLSNIEPDASGKMTIKEGMGIDDTLKEFSLEMEESRDSCQSDGQQSEEKSGSGSIFEASLDESQEETVDVLSRSEELVSELSSRDVQPIRLQQEPVEHEYCRNLDDRNADSRDVKDEEECSSKLPLPVFPVTVLSNETSETSGTSSSPGSCFLWKEKIPEDEGVFPAKINEILCPEMLKSREVSPLDGPRPETHTDSGSSLEVVDQNANKRSGDDCLMYTEIESEPNEVVALLVASEQFPSLKSQEHEEGANLEGPRDDKLEEENHVELINKLHVISTGHALDGTAEQFAFQPVLEKIVPFRVDPVRKDLGLYPETMGSRELSVDNQEVLREESDVGLSLETLQEEITKGQADTSLENEKQESEMIKEVEVFALPREPIRKEDGIEAFTANEIKGTRCVEMGTEIPDNVSVEEHDDSTKLSSHLDSCLLEEEILVDQGELSAVAAGNEVVVENIGDLSREQARHIQYLPDDSLEEVAGSFEKYKETVSKVCVDTAMKMDKSVEEKQDGIEVPIEEHDHSSKLSQNLDSYLVEEEISVFQGEPYAEVIHNREGSGKVGGISGDQANSVRLLQEDSIKEVTSSFAVCEETVSQIDVETPENSQFNENALQNVTSFKDVESVNGDKNIEIGSETQGQKYNHVDTKVPTEASEECFDNFAEPSCGIKSFLPQDKEMETQVHKPLVNSTMKMDKTAEGNPEADVMYKELFGTTPINQAGNEINTDSGVISELSSGMLFNDRCKITSHPSDQLTSDVESSHASMDSNDTTSIFLVDSLVPEHVKTESGKNVADYSGSSSVVTNSVESPKETGFAFPEKDKEPGLCHSRSKDLNNVKETMVKREQTESDEFEERTHITHRQDTGFSHDAKMEAECITRTDTTLSVLIDSSVQGCKDIGTTTSAGEDNSFEAEKELDKDEKPPSAFVPQDHCHGIKDGKEASSKEDVVTEYSNNDVCHSMPGVTDNLDKDIRFYIVRLRRNHDDKLASEIEFSQFQVEEKTQNRDAVGTMVRTQKAKCDELWKNVEEVRKEERACRQVVASKYQELRSIREKEDMIELVNSIDDTDDKMNSIQHRIQHETIPLKEEKELLRKIKELKHKREDLSSKLAPQAEMEKAFEQKGEIQDQLKHLALELDSLRKALSQAEAKAKAAKKKYDDECLVLRNLQEQYRTADDLRQAAYAHLRSLRKELNEKNMHFYKYKDDARAASTIASTGDREALRSHCCNQIERFMELWNNNDGFRNQYVNTNQFSIMRRFGTLDGRSLGPDEEPAMLPYAPGKSSNDIDFPQLKRDSALPRERKENEQSSTGGNSQSQTEKAPQNKPRNGHSSSSSSERADEPIVEKIVKGKQKKPHKPNQEIAAAPVSTGESKKEDKERARSMADLEDAPTKSKEETTKTMADELARKKEEEEEARRKEHAAAELKEKIRLEQIAKSREAEERKRRKVEKAKAIAEIKAQKEAELKEKKRAKKERLKEKKATSSADSATGRNEAELTPSPPSEAVENSEAKVLQAPPLPAKQQHSGKKPLPPPLRNRGKRKIQTWMWVLLCAAIVGILFFLGNYASLRRLEFLGF